MNFRLPIVDIMFLSAPSDSYAFASCSVRAEMLLTFDSADLSSDFIQGFAVVVLPDNRALIMCIAMSLLPHAVNRFGHISVSMTYSVVGFNAEIKRLTLKLQSKGR